MNIISCQVSTVKQFLNNDLDTSKLKGALFNNQYYDESLPINQRQQT